MKFSIPDPFTVTGALKWIAVLVAAVLSVKFALNLLAKVLPPVADIQAGGTGSRILNTALAPKG